jgi:hypothetical protein
MEDLVIPKKGTYKGKEVKEVKDTIFGMEQVITPANMENIFGANRTSWIQWRMWLTLR